MRVPVPPRTVRDEVVHALQDAYESSCMAEVREAFARLVEFYGVPFPHFRWLKRHERLDRLGYFDGARGTIALMHPDQWRRQRRRGTPRNEWSWVHTALHEWNHYLMSLRVERRADIYADAFLHGVED